MTLKLIPHTLAIATLLLTSTYSYAQQKAHVHGISNMDIVVEGNAVMLDFKSPLANLIHFEHAPKNSEETTAVKNMAASLRNVNNMFTFPESAGCTIKTVKLTSEGLFPELLGEKGAAAHQDAEEEHDQTEAQGHMDIDAGYDFTCKKPENLTYLDVKLINSFSGIERLNVQGVTPKRQLSTTLTQSSIRVPLK